ncbi:hypothetical protein D9M68_761670 [compost metagenome]
MFSDGLLISELINKVPDLLPRVTVTKVSYVSPRTPPAFVMTSVSFSPAKLSGMTDGALTAPLTVTLREAVSRVVTMTSGSTAFPFSASTIRCLACSRVRPVSVTPPTYGIAALPSG